MTVIKPFLPAVVLATVTAALAADPAKEDAAKADAAKLQGTWQVTKFIDHSEEAAPAAEIEHMAFEFKGDRVTMRRTKDDPGREGKYTLDPAKRPKSIDIDFGVPVSEGIYKLDGDTLTICVVGGSRNGKTAARPTEFRASKRDKYSLFELKKVKK